MFLPPDPVHCYVDVAIDNLELTGLELQQHLHKWVLFVVGLLYSEELYF